MLSEKKIEIVLVRAPITNSRNLSYASSHEFDKMMKKHKNYYNLNGALHLQDSVHFYDQYHMNQTGVDLFNKKLIGLINLKAK